MFKNLQFWNAFSEVYFETSVVEFNLGSITSNLELIGVELITKLIKAMLYLV